jgi:hypothetical protein
MPHRKQLSHVIDKIITSTESTVRKDIIEDYKELNEKCDQVISKIKVRKEKSRKKS